MISDVFSFKKCRDTNILIFGVNISFLNPASSFPTFEGDAG